MENRYVWLAFELAILCSIFFSVFWMEAPLYYIKEFVPGATPDIASINRDGLSMGNDFLRSISSFLASLAIIVVGASGFIHFKIFRSIIIKNIMVRIILFINCFFSVISMYYHYIILILLAESILTEKEFFEKIKSILEAQAQMLLLSFFFLLVSIILCLSQERLDD